MLLLRLAGPVASRDESLAVLLLSDPIIVQQIKSLVHKHID